MTTLDDPLLVAVAMLKHQRLMHMGDINDDEMNGYRLAIKDLVEFINEHPLITITKELK